MHYNYKPFEVDPKDWSEINYIELKKKAQGNFDDVFYSLSNRMKRFRTKLIFREVERQLKTET